MKRCIKNKAKRKKALALDLFSFYTDVRASSSAAIFFFQANPEHRIYTLKLSNFKHIAHKLKNTESFI